MAEIMIPGHIEGENLRVTGIIPQLMREKFEKKVSNYTDFYLQKGENYIKGYLSSFEANPIRKLIAKNIICNMSAKYSGANLALEKLIGEGENGK